MFTQSTREYYDLETLWTVGPKYDPKCQEEVVTEQLYSLSDLPWLEELEQAEGIVKASSQLKSNTDFQHSPK